MSRVRAGAVVVLALTFAFSAGLAGQVKTKERTLVKFEGAIGRVVGMFGGKAASEGIVQTVAVQGDRKASMGETSGQIIDLAEEKIYDIDVRGKSYKVTTFAEMRRQMEEAAEEAEKEARKEEGRQEEGAKEYEIDFDVKPTGQTKKISGYDTKQAIVTITVREKGKTLEQAGGMVLTADTWLAPKIPAMNEMMEFDRRYAEKLFGPGGIAGAQGDQMAMAAAMWPGMKEAMAKWQAEGASLDGTPLTTIVTVTAVASAEQAAAMKEQEQERPRSGGIGGMLGGLGKRIAKKKPEETNPAEAGRTTIMTTTTEVLSVGTDVAPGDVAIPEGFKEKK